MKITLHIEQDAEAAACCWPDVTRSVRSWAATYVSPVPEVCPAPPGGMELSMSLQVDDFLSAISQLHRNLYELQVNFTLSVD